MNYIEWALQRGMELWREREEALKKRLSLVPEGTAQKKAAEAQLSEEEAAAQDAEMSGGAERRFLPIWRALRRRTLRFCARGRPRARTMRPTG